MPEGGISLWELPAEILALPAGHLQLSQRAQLALREHETIRGLVPKIQSGQAAWTKSVRSEILFVLSQLSECLQSDLEKGWDQFRRARRKMTTPMVIYFTSFTLDRLRQSVLDLPIGTLHMGGRVRAALTEAKIKTLGDLIHCATRGLALSHPAGSGACLEIIDTLEAISHAVEKNGECAWDRYADSRGIIVLPRHEDREFLAEKYLQAFPAVVQAAAGADFGECGAAFTTEHLLCAEDQQVPLIKIGNRFGMSSSTASRVRNTIVSKLRGAFVCDDYAGCRFRFRSGFTWPIRMLGTELLRRKGRAIAYFEWRKIVNDCWSTKLDCLGTVERCILEILGFQLITFDQPRLRSVILPFSRKADPIRAAMIEADRLLTRRYVSGLSRIELVNALKRISNNDDLRDADICTIIHSVRGVRLWWGARQYVRSFPDLKSLANRLEDALRKKSAPTHFRELTKLVNQNASGTRRRSEVVDAVLSADKRFVPMMETGYWSLTEWGCLETRSCKQSIKD